MYHYIVYSLTMNIREKNSLFVYYWWNIPVAIKKNSSSKTEAKEAKMRPKVRFYVLPTKFYFPWNTQKYAYKLFHQTSLKNRTR